MKQLFGILIIFGLIGGIYVLRQDHVDDAQVNAGQEEVITVYEPKKTYQERPVQDGDTFTNVMEDLGLSYADALVIVENGTDIFDFTSIKLGKVFKLVKLDNVSDHIEYEPNSEQVVIIDLQNDLAVRVEDIEYETQIAHAQLTIQNSMYADGVAAGMSPELIIEFANVFAWEIDFATQVQEGDSFRILYEKRYRDGKEAGIGNVLAGEFVNVGNSIQGYRYEHENGDVAYYNQEGESLIRPFLKAPLSFSRITSGYTNARFHPVLGRSTPHLAIDYAAPLGTPIKAVGDGVIRQARYNGGYGNFIQIRHNERFTTNYAHLSRYASIASPGTRVKQGDVIGYVGSTGFSTGPHLHYEVLVNGTKVNPLQVEFPKGDSVAEEDLDAYTSAMNELKKQLFQE